MGYSRDEQLDLLRHAVVELAKANAAFATAAMHPDLFKLVQFDRECEANLAAERAEAERRAKESVEKANIGLPPGYTWN